MMQHAFKRGLFFIVAASVTRPAFEILTGGKFRGVSEFLGIRCGLASAAGFVLLICGVLNFLKRRFGKP